MISSPLDAAPSPQDLRTSRSLFLAAIVVLLYDHLLMLPAEVIYIWTPARHKKKSSALYLLIRYFALCSNMAMFSFLLGNFTPEICDKLQITNEILMVAQELLVGCTLILRVLALYSFNKRVAVTLICAAMIVVAVAAWCILTGALGPTENIGLIGCWFTASRAQIRNGMGGTVECTIFRKFPQLSDRPMLYRLVGDILLVGFTLYHGYERSRSEIFHNGTLWQVLVRDGAVYFGLSSIPLPPKFALSLSFRLQYLKPSSCLLITNGSIRSLARSANQP
ncbi:hypothetical protein B0H19DRAFT_1065846 [Mycena capillaripes]|nr:hypothetical protein B0H19DRAFT_1065846 [Mycena capillaripes]